MEPQTDICLPMCTAALLSTAKQGTQPVSIKGQMVREMWSTFTREQSPL